MHEHVIWLGLAFLHLCTKMADDKEYKGPNGINSTLSRDEGETPRSLAGAQVQGEEQFKVADSQKIGVTGAVFLILNKMIGTGST